MSHPRVSVVMAVYNGARFLAEAITSVLGQSFADLELVLVDDGSVDDSARVIAEFDDPRIRTVRNSTNLGLARSLNRGIGLARGELVARLDADDVAEPHRLSRQIAFLDAHPGVAALGSWYLKIDEHGGLLGERRLPCDAVPLRWALLFYCPFVHSAMMCRNSILTHELGGYDEQFRYSLDYELWRRIADRYDVANLSEYLVRVRVHTGSMTSMGGDDVHEGRDQRHRRLTELLGWEVLDAVSLQRRLHGLTSLAWQAHDDALDFDADVAVDDVYHTLSVFSERWQLSRRQRQRLRREVEVRLLTNLLRLLRRRVGAGSTLAAYTASRALALHPGLLLRGSAARTTQSFRREAVWHSRERDPPDGQQRSSAPPPLELAVRRSPDGAHRADPPRVSVITPFRNEARFLGEAVASVKAQSFTSWELILVDDGSTDGSEQLARAYAEAEPGRIRYLRTRGEGQGASAARNLGITHARGEWIALLDGDDVWHPEKLLEQLALADSHPEVDVLVGRTLYWSSWRGDAHGGAADYVPPLGLLDGSILEGTEYLRLYLGEKTPVPCTCSLLVRASLARRVGGFEERFRFVFTDQAFYAKIFLEGRVYLADACWDRYRIRADSMYHTAKRVGEIRPIRITYYDWLTTYIRDRGIRDRRLLRALARRRFLARHRRIAAFLARIPTTAARRSLMPRRTARAGVQPSSRS